ncbi:MAG: ArsR/SmtB family transcription factor [Bacillota bacterium]
MEPKPVQRNKNQPRILADLLKALADETRLSILTMLMDGEMCVCEIIDALPLSQPAISHHLKVLRQAGLVIDRREGKWIYYDIDAAGFDTVQALLGEVILVPLRHREFSAKRHHPCCPDN